MLNNHETVELQGRGAAIPVAADIAVYLLHINKGKMEKIHTHTVGYGRVIPKPEVIITLRTTGKTEGHEELSDRERELIGITKDEEPEHHDDGDDEDGH